MLERARSIYLGEAEDRWDDLAPQLRPHAEYVVREIRQRETLSRSVAPTDSAE